MSDIPLPLRQALEAGDCVLFVGAGIGRHLMRKGIAAPDGATLARKMATDFKFDPGSNPTLPKVSQVAELRKGRPELEIYLTTELCDFEPDPCLQWITGIRWRAIFTTNYEDGIERTYARAAAPVQVPVVIATSSEIVEFDRRIQVPLYHLHGRLCPNKTRIVITEKDYADFRHERAMLFEILKLEFAKSTFLYVGYSNEDPNWKMLREELRSEFYPSSLPPSFRVAPSTDSLDREILKAQAIDTIDCDFEEFQRSATIALAGAKITADTLRSMQSSVPSELASAFEQSPAAVVRLLNSWDYVNQVSFSNPPNTHDFFRGDKANWSLVANGIPFERDLEEEVYDALLDYGTSSTKRPTALQVLAPAGYGTTTFMRMLAVRLVKDRAGPVFFHKEGTPLNEGDILFAASVFASDRPFFFIDNAADVERTISTTVQTFRNAGKQGLFLSGERLNEWRYVRRGRAPGREFVIEPLSDPEIDRLLQSLDSANELNKLGELSPELRVAAIKQNYQQELLVTLREATEGKAFDAILEDEFRSIGNAVARDFYLIVCCFYQHGALVRDTLIAEMLKLSTVRLFQVAREALPGVVIFEDPDPSYGHQPARARHRKIAAVVWERCGDPTARERIIIDALSRMNLNYRTDMKAFEDFTRSDRLVDSIRTLDDRVRFFETACKKGPVIPYVRQHYARMLARAQRFNLALSQIEAGIEMAPDIRVLHHTKGLILRELATSTESREIGRRRLAQSEEEFLFCKRLNERDEYAYQGLAELYVHWAKHVEDDSTEAADYLAKAEAVIGEGLKKVRVHDGLWIISSEIKKIIGDGPDYLSALVKAASAPSAGTVAKYLLGRAYREAGDPRKAIGVLQPVIEANTEEFRSSVECARAMEMLGEPYSKCIAVLCLSTLYGYSDPRFLATLGGMLFMNKEFSRAEEVFAQAMKREFPAQEERRIQYRPLNPKNLSEPLRLIGKVATVKAGYAFINASGYPRFFCRGTKFGGIVMRAGLEVEFQVAFTARSQIADAVRLPR